MQKKFLTNLAFLVLLNLLIKPFWIFGIDRTVQNMIGAEVYGKYYALLNFSFLLNIFLDFGITNYNNRNIAQNKHLVSKHFTGIVILRFLLASVYFILSLVIGLFIGYSTADMQLLLVLLFNQFILSFILYLRSNLTGLQLFKRDSIISVTDRFLMITFCAILIWGANAHTLDIRHFVYAQTLGYLITALLAIAFLKGKIVPDKLNWNPAFYVAILKKSFPYALLILLMNFYSRIDSIMIERLLPDGAFQAGVYAQAYRILDAVNMFAYLFATLLLPMFAHMIKQKQNVNDLVKLSFSLLSIPSITLAAMATFYKYNIMELLYHYHTELSAPVFGVLMFSFFCMATSYIFGTLLTANGSVRQLNIMAACAMVLNVVLNLILIPQLKAYGASLAGFITQLLTAIVQAVIAYRIFRLHPGSGFFVRLLIFAVSIFLMAYLCSLFISNWIMGAACVMLAGVAAAFGLKLIHVSKLMAILRER